MISSSHAVAKGVRTTPAQLHICYCYTPMRYAWDLQDQYLSQVGLDKGVRGRVVRGSLARLRRWDRHASERVGHFVAISNTIARAHPPMLWARLDGDLPAGRARPCNAPRQPATPPTSRYRVWFRTSAST